jgi:hypothetical protein
MKLENLQLENLQCKDMGTTYVIKVPQGLSDNEIDRLAGRVPATQNRFSVNLDSEAGRLGYEVSKRYTNGLALCHKRRSNLGFSGGKLLLVSK